MGYYKNALETWAGLVWSLAVTVIFVYASSEASVETSLLAIALSTTFPWADTEQIIFEALEFKKKELNLFGTWTNTRGLNLGISPQN